MYHGQQDLVWLVPLFVAGLFLGVAAQQWVRVAIGKKVGDSDLKPRSYDLRMAATATAVGLGALSLAILLVFWVRLA